MKLATFQVNGQQHFGAISDQRVVDLTASAAVAAFKAGNGGSAAPGSLQEFLEGGDSTVNVARQIAEDAGGVTPGNSADADALVRDLGAVKLLAPLRPRQIIAVGRNYLDHASEAAIDLPTMPRIFPKWPSSIVGQGDPILKPALTNQLDWEAELAVVIGKRADRVTVDNALSHVAGYTLLNDVSARDIQFAKPEQLALSKNFRSFTPLGGWITTADEVGDPGTVPIKSWVNDELMQDSNTKHLIFDVPRLISFISGALPLEVGDIISTGTPAGTGAFREPPVYLQDGDEVRMSLGDWCTLSNPVASD